MAPPPIVKLPAPAPPPTEILLPSRSRGIWSGGSGRGLPLPIEESGRKVIRPGALMKSAGLSTTPFTLIDAFGRFEPELALVKAPPATVRLAGSPATSAIPLGPAEIEPVLWMPAPIRAT